MPLRRIIFASNEIYHVLNRGVASTPIFETSSNYDRFLKLINYYRFKKPPLSFSKYLKLPHEQRTLFEKHLMEEGRPQVEIYSYCLMPNHFHILLKQLEDKGIQKTLSNLQNSYSRYFNLKTKREGPLFQSRFKAKRIESDEIFLHVSRYIHLNPTTSYLVEASNLSNYPWSSFPEYLKTETSEFIKKNVVLNIAGGIENYKRFIFNQVDYQRKLNKIKHLLLER